MTKTIGGTGTKTQIRVGYSVSSIKFQVPVRSGTGPCRTLRESTCITGEVIHRHKSFEYVPTTTSNFPWPQNCSGFLAYDKLRINL